MNHIVVARLAAALAVGTALAAGNEASAQSSHAASTSAEWRPLFDSSMSAWRGYKEQAMPAGWTFKDGVVSKTVSSNDLITKEEFQNFELTFDWKLHKGGNAGVFYRGDESGEKIYYTGPEYQLLDDAGHPDGKSRLTAAGSDYALYPSPAGVVKPAEQWNSSRILVNGKHVEHWLNGKKVVEYEFGSADWEKRLKASKFATAPKYGRLEKGHIGLQGDHAGALNLRNMKIRVLP